jgi:hypothetical protein
MNRIDERALNSSAWKFIAMAREVGCDINPKMWNNLKAMLRPAIVKYLEDVGKSGEVIKMKEIKLDGKYTTRDGREVRIYAVDCGGDYPVHGAIYSKEDREWVIQTWTLEGLFDVTNPLPDCDLIPAKTYPKPEDFKVDDRVYVRDSERGRWITRYFSRYTYGIFYTWGGGVTSWSAKGEQDVSSWKNCISEEEYLDKYAGERG